MKKYLIPIKLKTKQQDFKNNKKVLDNLINNLQYKFENKSTSVLISCSTLLGAFCAFFIQFVSYVWYYSYALYFKIDFDYVLVNEKFILYSIVIFAILFIVIGYPAYHTVRSFFIKIHHNFKIKITLFLIMLFLFFPIIIMMVLPFTVQGIWNKSSPEQQSIIMPIFLAAEFILGFLFIFNLLGFGIFSNTKEFDCIRGKTYKNKNKKCSIGGVIFTACTIIFAIIVYVAILSYSNAASKSKFDILIEQPQNNDLKQVCYAVLSKKDGYLYVVECKIIEDNKSKKLELESRKHKLLQQDRINLIKETFDEVTVF
ncbi:hypothetical protein EDD70_0506 [Hydrogenoanaerobacterium saccharovorans]|uniref:Uncharacterized protein n=1 Tax=Hydrogenoanaerobacterium saccharovorans TaxID=474960 RepID=A0A1H8AWP5_9FIRM|nr:hypothetical protein [Hydrogenoanaerobacterium saccharovorans]RPF47707.1 hypothetical protein EDD70_0506 [Hydrogenoanaerobacterium saccharovorans]SEM75095.1 hypothetical protein SAMN05216180_1585 [Hydrogenoanaerobacterium saccharovorans]